MTIVLDFESCPRERERTLPSDDEAVSNCPSRSVRGVRMFHQTVARWKSDRNRRPVTICSSIRRSNTNTEGTAGNPMSKISTRGDIVGGRGGSFSGARRGQSLWDSWNESEGTDELAVAMNLLAVVRRDRAFSREVVRAFGMTRTDEQRRPSRGKSSRPGSLRRARG
jgi:hypothetical protein